MTRTIFGLALLMVSVPAFAQSDDRGAVRQAALDYVTAVYESRPELIERSVSPRDTSVKEVIVGDVFDQTATAMVRAQWGVDLMQLAKIDGRWKILNIVWQSHPPAKSTQ